MEPRQGPKKVVSGKNGVVSSSHPCVSEIMIGVLKNGGDIQKIVVAVLMNLPDHLGL